ncbi:MAG: NUDIX hydrolase [Clostridia bacterium]|nr:NUDIX hydrolase [Clostridia bacterium]MBR0026587.1 NUDIX hydrolase [Clostridia bacterium]
MLFRNCAGGVVFFGEQVFLLKNEKDEWVLPKGVIRSGQLSQEVALQRVKEEAGIQAEILCPAGATSYEFYSITRKMPVCNDITWYVMRAKNAESRYSPLQGFTAGRYFYVEDALQTATYSQDKALIRQAYSKYKNLV